MSDYFWTVCVHCMTYNHEKYLEDALKGFVMQKTNFPFVAVVIDDCSSDGTAEVLKRYEKAYPEIIRAVYLKENYYSQSKSKQPFLDPYDSKSKYIALCEGDDYWIDPLKLQKQVDFMESNEEYSMCFHAARILEDGVHVGFTAKGLSIVDDRDYSANELFCRWTVPTASILFRKETVLNFATKHREWLVYGDIDLVLRCSHTGKVRGLSEIMSVYRQQPSSVLHHEAHLRHIRILLPWHFKYILYNFPLVDSTSVKCCISDAYYSRMKIQTNVFRKIGDLCRSFYWFPSIVTSKIRTSISNFLKLS